MAQAHNFRFLCLLLAGGLIFSFLTGYPQCLLSASGSPEDMRPAMAAVSDDSVSDRDSDFNKIDKDNTADRKMDADETDNTAEQKMDAGKTDKPNVLSENAMTGYATTGYTENKEADTYNKPVKFAAVEDDYFKDACFIGDSRVVSLYEYSDWTDADYYCSSGMTLGGVFGEPSTKFKDGNWKVNIATALQHSHYGKIYIMLGINDMGVGDLDYFVNHYQDMIEKIRKWQPDAVIYIQSIMNVSAARSAQGDYINNEAIRVRNAKLKEMDNGTDTFYLDINSVVCDETGALNPVYTFDGVHLYAQYVPIWTEYLKTHAVIK